MENILKNICNTIVTEDDCRNQIIQDALGVSCDEELNDLWKTLLVDSPKKDEEKVFSSEDAEKKESNAQLSEDKERKNDTTGESSLTESSKEKADISYNEPVFTLQLFSDEEISADDNNDDDDKQSIMVCITLFFENIKISNLNVSSSILYFLKKKYINIGRVISGLKVFMMILTKVKLLMIG